MNPTPKKKRNRPGALPTVRRISLPVDEALNLAISRLFNQDSSAGNRRWLVRLAFAEAIYAIADRFDGNEGFALPLRFEIVKGESRERAHKDEMEAINAALDAATVSAETLTA